MIERIAMVVAVVAASASPAPLPSPSSAAVSEKPVLKTIATVRASASCGEIVTHANSAIAAALNNDVLVGQTIMNLRGVNLDDGNSIHRRNGLQMLGDYAKNLMKQSRSADDEVKRLRAIAAKSKDPVQQKELKAFADELGGALWRQQKIARDLNGFLAAVDFRDMMTLDEDQKKANIGALGVADPKLQTPSDWGQTNPNYTQAQMRGSTLSLEALKGTATGQARAAAEDFQQRIPAIANDETMAADHAESGAFNGC
ncbi:MAG: hypothetical protein JO165_11205 [Candidatus Eremiobacteraeota bacterium]|nr:hypothetical protein [Candidatus Eremiobacteraeota bacterium]